MAVRRWTDRAVVVAWAWYWWVRLAGPSYRAWLAEVPTGAQRDFPTALVLQGVLLLIGLCAAKVLGMMFALVIDRRAERAHRHHARQAIEAAAMKASAIQRGGR